MNPERLSQALAAGVRMTRAERRISQAEAAERVGMSRGAWGDLESGRRAVGVGDLLPICEGLETTLPRLLGLTPEGAEVAAVLGVEV